MNFPARMKYGTAINGKESNPPNRREGMIVSGNLAEDRNAEKADVPIENTTGTPKKRQARKTNKSTVSMSFSPVRIEFLNVRENLHKIRNKHEGASNRNGKIEIHEGQLQGRSKSSFVGKRNDKSVIC